MLFLLVMICSGYVFAGASVSAVACDPSSASQAWDFGRANTTVWQVRDAADGTSCLTFNSTSLHMGACQVEHGDKVSYLRTCLLTTFAPLCQKLKL